MGVGAVGGEVISLEESRAWKPGLVGWSDDILQFYSEVATELEDGSTCVELGVFSGRSLSYLDFALRRLGKTRCKIVGVDAWPYGYGDRGSPLDREIAGAGGLYAWALRSFGQHALEHLANVRLVRWESADAARLFRDGSVDMCFVDASHRYADVIADLRAWAPKVRGIFAGHDYEPGVPLRAGVVGAVNDFFGGHGHVDRPIGSVWRHR